MIDESAPEFVSTTAVVLGSAVPRKVGLPKFRDKWLILFFCSLPDGDEDCDVEAVVARRVELEKKFGCRLLGVASGYTVEEITLWVRRRNNGKNSASKLQHFRSLGAADVCIISDADASIALRYGLQTETVAATATTAASSAATATRVIARGMFLLSPEGLVKYKSITGAAEKNIEEHLMLLQTYFFTDTQQKQQPRGDVRDSSHQNSLDFAVEDVEPPTGGWVPTSSNNNSSGGVAVSAVGSTVLGWYQRQLREAPLVTKALTSCAVGLLGELIGAAIAHFNATRRGERSRELTSWKNVVNARRLAIFGAYGLLVTGPFFHWWYGFLEKFVGDCKIKSSHWSFVLKLALNQLAMTPAFLLFTLSYINYFMTLSPSSTVLAIKRTYAAALFANWKVWTVAQAVNFQLVPLDYRVLFGNMVALWWNIYLSVVSNSA